MACDSASIIRKDKGSSDVFVEDKIHQTIPVTVYLE